MSGSTTKAPFRLQDVRDAILANEWVVYNRANDPGTLWTWGFNCAGQLGLNSTINRSSPVQVPGTSWIEVSASGINSIARKSDNTLWAWGSSLQGQTGQNDAIQRSSPVQIPGTSWIEISGSINGGHFTARKSDNTLWAWGLSGGGELGQNDTVTRSSPIQIPGTSWVDVSNYGNSSFARKSDGTLWAWGSNFIGQLGDNTTIYRSSPVQIPGTSWVEITGRPIARKSDNTLWSWGSTPGDGTMVAKSSPVQIPGTSWVEVAGGSAALARKSDGTLWAWGTGNFGQLGNGLSGAAAQRSSPIQIPGTQWVDIAGGSTHSMARKSDNTLWTWGSNTWGELGISPFPGFRSSPTQVPGTSWIEMAGGCHTLARKFV